MKLLIIIIKEFLEGIRDIKSMTLMVIMPTILTIILGIALKGSENFDIEFNDLIVIYEINNSNDYEKEVIESYIEVLKNMNIRCQKKTIDYGENKKNIIIYFNGINNINIKYSSNLENQGKFIEYILDGCIKNNKLSSVIHKNNLYSENKDTENYIILNSITGKYTTTSLDYYGVTMIVITIMFSAVIGAYKIIKEKQRGTLRKMKATAITNIEFLCGKTIGSLIIVLVQIVIAISISIYFLKVNWGNRIGLVALLLLCEGLFSITLGIFIGILVKDEKSAWIIILAIIMILGFFSGSFIQLGVISNKLIVYLSNFNLIKYENTALFNIIYNRGNLLAFKVCFIYLMLSLIMIKLTSKRMEE